MLCRPLQLHLLILISPGDVKNRGTPQRLVLSFPQVRLQNGHNILLAVVADGQVHRGVLLHRLPPGLHIAPHGHHHRVGVELPGPVEHLPALPVRDVGDSAGIHDIDIGLFIKRYNPISLFPEHLAHYFHLVGIHLAAQIIQCHIFHNHSPLFLYCFRLDFWLSTH